jgi:hypothetical protein
MIQAIAPWTDFGPYATKIAAFCTYVPGMQVRGRLHGGRLAVGRICYYPSAAGVIVIREQDKIYVLDITAPAPAPDLSDPITLAFVWPLLQKHLTVDELIALRVLAAVWSVEPPADIADDSPTADNDHD